MYEPSIGSSDAYVDYLNRAWPGTAVRIDSDAAAPELIEMLADQNPLNGNRDLSLLRPEPQRLRDGSTALAATL